MRLQVLHLPAPPDEFPFALVLDRVGDDMSSALAAQNAVKDIRDNVGARAVLVFAGEVEVA